MTIPYTRESFDGRRGRVKAVLRREGRVLALASVGLGVAQLLFIRWSDLHLSPRVAVPIEAALFLGYLALVGWLIWRMQRRIGAARPVCPQCGVVLDDMAERVAAATGKCDRCGGQVVE